MNCEFLARGGNEELTDTTGNYLSAVGDGLTWLVKVGFGFDVDGGVGLKYGGERVSSLPHSEVFHLFLSRWAVKCGYVV